MIKTRVPLAIFYGTFVFRVTLVGRRCLIDQICWSKILLYDGCIIRGWLYVCVCVCVCVCCTSVYYPNCVAYLDLTRGFVQHCEIAYEHTTRMLQLRFELSTWTQNSPRFSDCGHRDVVTSLN